MIDDARTLPIDADLDADITIVGGGAAGICMALRFARSKLRVVLLESGGLDYEGATQALYRGRNVGLRYEPLDLCRVRALGGSTNKRGWAGWSKIFEDTDFETKRWVRLSGWPISKRDLLPYYKDALATLYLPGDLEAQTEATRKGERFLSLDGDCINDPVALSTAPQLAKMWKTELADTPNIRIVLHANVTNIEMAANGRHVAKLCFSTLERRRFTSRPGIVVLAAGGIENARLLLANKPAMGEGADWVGRCFMDHPRYAWGQITHAPEPRLLRAYDPTHGVGQRRHGVPPPGAAPLIAGGIAVSAEARRREEILGSRTWILPVATQGERTGGREVRELVLWATRKRVPQDALKRLGMVLGDLPNAAAATIAHVKSAAGKVSRWHFLTIMEPEPDEESRVRLDYDVDALGMQRVKVFWKLTPLVEKSLHATQRLIVKSLSERGLACSIVGAGGPAANQDVETPRWVWHHMGTTRMSSSPKTGVVDSDCKVHGIDNLYVAGSSVYPTSSTDMPTLTLMALAYRLTDHLSQRLGVRLADAGNFDNKSRFEPDDWDQTKAVASAMR